MPLAFPTDNLYSLKGSVGAEQKFHKLLGQQVLFCCGTE